jgi:tetrahydromethanopterin S-methyltransferase subunit D
MSPEPIMAGLDLSPPLRRLAALSDPRLGLAYTGGILPSVLLRGWAESHANLAWLNLPAALLAVVSLSALIAVVAFYRDDDPVLAGILLAGITGIGTGIALVVTTAIVTGSIGAAIVLVAGGSFVLVVRLILLAPIMAGAVWLARRFRRYLAPDSMSDEG